MKCEKINITDFIAAWFNHEYDNLNQDDFEIVYAEYVDLSGLYHSKEFELFAYINYLKNRIFVLRTVVASQRMFLETLGRPYVDGLFIFDNFGYKIKWNDDIEDFERQLKIVESRERQKSSELRRKEFEFKQLKDAKKSEEQPLIQSRHNFIRMLNSFNKAGYKIDRDKTTVEELALMIKQVNDEMQEYELKKMAR